MKKNKTLKKMSKRLQMREAFDTSALNPMLLCVVFVYHDIKLFNSPSWILNL